MTGLEVILGASDAGVLVTAKVGTVASIWMLELLPETTDEFLVADRFVCFGILLVPEGLSSLGRTRTDARATAASAVWLGVILPVAGNFLDASGLITGFLVGSCEEMCAADKSAPDLIFFSTDTI
jgi:hypothetical protein